MIFFRRSFNFFLSLAFSMLVGNTAASHELCPVFPKEDFKSCNEQMTKGDDFFEAGLYEKALEIYKELLQPNEQQFIENDDTLKFNMQCRFRLAYTLFLLEDYQAALSLIDENIKQNLGYLPSNLESIAHHSLYLKALLLKKSQKNIEALHAFQTYLNTRSNLETAVQENKPLFYEEAVFEIGLIHFQSGNYEEASEAFASLDSEKSKKRLSILAKFYLARIALQQKNDAKAADILEPLHSKLAEDDPLLFELYYLKGEISFSLNDYFHASTYFNQALSFNSQKNSSWYEDALYHLGWSYLKMAEEISKDPSLQEDVLKKAEKTFTQLDSGITLLSQKERASLALAHCYLSEAKHLNAPLFYTKAEELLSKKEVYFSKEAEEEALFLRAEAAPTYAFREQFYRKLTEEDNKAGIFYAKGWYMRALNDFEHGQELFKQQSPQAAKNILARSGIEFRKSFELLKEENPPLAGAALKYQALAISDSNTEEGSLKAFQILDELMNDNPAIWEAVPNKAEIYYLHGYFSGQNARGFDKEKNLAIAYRSLKTASSHSNSIFSGLSLYLLAALHYENNEQEQAENVYLNLAKTYPASPFAAEAWFWAACCADNLGRELKIGKERRQYAYENYPDSPFAAEAFFTYYTYSDYLQGDRAAIKHLQNFISHHSDSPYLIDAYYLTGLDFKRDRKTPEGKWIRKRNLTEAIDSFQKAEVLFDELFQKNLIPTKNLKYYIAMRYRATLERAMINIAVAEEAQGAKRQIYLDYAKEVLIHLSQELQNGRIQEIDKGNDYPLIEEECSFWLAQTFIKANCDGEANRILSCMIERYRNASIEKGYYLSRTFEELGEISFRNQDYKEAMGLFKKAEEAARGGVLSTDQKLELWIAQSLCHRELGQFDEAILILSKVVNDDAISALRLKAMFMRAETYELQKRPELARKQLESMVKKGGIWAIKAQEKLDKDYCNHGH